MPVRDSSLPDASGGVDDGEGAEDSGAEQPADERLAAIDAALAPGEAALVKSLLLRAAFGGMAGDQAMLRRLAKLWQCRWAAMAVGMGIMRPASMVGLPRCTLQGMRGCVHAIPHLPLLPLSNPAAPAAAHAHFAAHLHICNSSQLHIFQHTFTLRAVVWMLST